MFFKAPFSIIEIFFFTFPSKSKPIGNNNKLKGSSYKFIFSEKIFSFNLHY